MYTNVGKFLFQFLLWYMPNIYLTLSKLKHTPNKYVYKML